MTMLTKFIEIAQTTIECNPDIRKFDSVNSCFINPHSKKCLNYIACKRNISIAAAITLKQKAEKLYTVVQDPQPFAVYDGQTVWVACLASPGLLRPGPDSDCAACGNACTQESRAEICSLYCSWEPSVNIISKTISFRKTTTKVKVKESLMADKEIRKINSTIDLNMNLLNLDTFSIILLLIGVNGLCLIVVILILIIIFLYRNVHQKRMFECYTL